MTAYKNRQGRGLPKLERWSQAQIVFTSIGKTCA